MYNQIVLHKENIMKNWAAIIFVLLIVTSCTKETQNKIGRAVQNWTGTDGILEVYAGDKLV